MGLLYQKTSFAVNIFTTVHRNFICYFNIIFLHHKVSFCYYRYLTLTVILLKVPLCEYIYITQVPLFFAFTLPELLTVAIDESMIQNKYLGVSLLSASSFQVAALPLS